MDGTVRDTALQWIHNMVLDLFIDNAATATQTFIQLRWIPDLVLDMFVGKSIFHVRSPTPLRGRKKKRAEGKEEVKKEGCGKGM